MTALLLAALLVSPDPIQDAFQRLYNFDFAGAHKILDSYIPEHREDPLGHTVRAATYLFYELDRLQVLAGEFLTDDKKISDDNIPDPDPRIRERFFASIDEAQRLADERIAKNPRDTTALFTFCLTEGKRTDYMAFIEKKQLRSLGAAKRSNSYAVELLKIDPTFVDAYLTRGLTEYLAGSLPFFIRWFIRFEDTKASKDAARQNLEKVAKNGRYLGPFARILLSIMHVREDRPQAAIQELTGLVEEFPENGLLRRELQKLRIKHPGPAIRSAP